MTHQVKAEGIHLVLFGPCHQRVNHELLEHGVFAGRVLATSARFHRPIGVQAVVIAGHDAVKDRQICLPRGVGVVVDHVHHHQEVVFVQRLHHLAELHDAGGAIGVGAVASFGHCKVERVVAPVKAILVADAIDEGLLLGGAGAVASQHPVIGFHALIFVFIDGGNVERRQEVNVG